MAEINKLSNINILKKLWQGYEADEQAIKIFKNIRYYPLAGISSSGRDSLIRSLKLNYEDVYDLVTTTTRKPRINNGKLEENGVEYFFVSEDQFLDKIKNKQMLEWAIIHAQQLSGLDSATLTDIPNGNYIINDIEIAGALKLIKQFNTIKPIFILPPSFKEWQARLSNRGEMPREEFIQRMRSAKKELILGLEEPKFHFIINDDLEVARDEIYKYMSEAVACDQTRARIIAREIMNEIDDLVKQG